MLEQMAFISAKETLVPIRKVIVAASIRNSLMVNIQNLISSLVTNANLTNIQIFSSFSFSLHLIFEKSASSGMDSHGMV